MADVPRDPRQLARDILSGKVKIEDLQRERQMRAGAAAAPPSQRVPDKIPLPRTAQQTVHKRAAETMRDPSQRAPAQRVPEQRTMQTRPPQTPAARVPPARLPAQARSAIPAKTVPRVEAVNRNPAPGREMKAYDLPTAFETAAQVSAGARKELGLARLMKSHRAARQGIMMAEILGKPLSLRERE